MGGGPPTLRQAHLTIHFLVAAVVAAAAATGMNGGVLQLLKIEAATGPESLAFDPTGKGPYTGVSDGRIIRWLGSDGGWQNFAFPTQWGEGGSCDNELHMEEECGRPLGLQFNERTGELYVADAYFGLTVVPPEGGRARRLASEAGGIPFRFTNGIDVDQNTGLVYFTDSSTHFQRWEYELVVAMRDATGRLLKYDPSTNEVTVLLSGLTYPNGVALSQDGSFILVAGTTDCLVSRYWLRGPEAGRFETFAMLPGYPDNIKRNSNGEFWVAMTTERISLDGAKFTGAMLSAVKLSHNGKFLGEVDARLMSPLSEVEERNGTLWLGSVELPFVGVI